MPVKIQKRGKIWHYSGTVAGRRLRGSTGATDKTIAQRIAVEKEAKAWTGYLDGPEAQLTFAQAALSYREAQKPTRFLAKIEDYWRDTLVRDMSSRAIRQSAIRLYPQASAATRNRQVIVPTQAIINHAAKNEWCTAITVPRFKVKTRSKEPATLEWVDQFVAHASPHLGALCLFMYSTGARISEAVSLTWQDVDLAKATAMINQTKTGSQRLAHLPSRALAAMANIPSDRQCNSRVFNYARRDSPKNAWVATCQRAGIKPLSFHCCRHGFATALLRKGIDVATIAKLGGWESTALVVKTYGHAISDTTLTDRIFDTNLTQDYNDDNQAIEI